MKKNFLIVILVLLLTSCISSINMDEMYIEPEDEVVKDYYDEDTIVQGDVLDIIVTYEDLLDQNFDWNLMAEKDGYLDSAVACTSWFKVFNKDDYKINFMYKGVKYETELICKLNDFCFMEQNGKLHEENVFICEYIREELYHHDRAKGKLRCQLEQKNIIILGGRYVKGETNTRSL